MYGEYATSSMVSLMICVVGAHLEEFSCMRSLLFILDAVITTEQLIEYSKTKKPTYLFIRECSRSTTK